MEGYDRFLSELEELDVPALEMILCKVKSLLEQKQHSENFSLAGEANDEHVEQALFATCSMKTVWESLKDDKW